MAEALAENNRLPVTNDMANQSCFITAIAFLKFEFLAPVQRLAGFAPAQTEAVQSGVKRLRYRKSSMYTFEHR